MVTKETVQAAFDLKEYLESRGFKCIIAGGFARDMYFGIVPKDIDIVVVNSTMGTLQDALEASHVSFGMFFKYDEATDDRITGGFKLSTADIDVILYNCLEVEDAVNAFDYNINQFALANTRGPIGEATIRYQGEGKLDSLRRVRNDTSAKRDEKMAKKHCELLTLPFGYILMLELPEASLGNRLGIL
jgi:hypothetical protein